MRMGGVRASRRRTEGGLMDGGIDCCGKNQNQGWVESGAKATRAATPPAAARRTSTSSSARTMSFATDEGRGTRGTGWTKRDGQRAGRAYGAGAHRSSPPGTPFCTPAGTSSDGIDPRRRSRCDRACPRGSRRPSSCSGASSRGVNAAAARESVPLRVVASARACAAKTLFFPRRVLRSFISRSSARAAAAGR